MGFENDILVVYVDGGDDDSFMPWVESFCDNIQASITQINKSIPEISRISVTDELLEQSIVSSQIVILLFPKLISTEQLAIINSLNSQITEKQSVYLLFTRLFAYSELDVFFWTKPFYLFFDHDPDNNLSRFYNEDSSGNESRLYWSKILEFSYELNQVLVGAGDSRKVIYLAETNPDQYEYRDAIKSELTHRGFRVVPSHIILGPLKEKTEQIEKYLQSAVMSIHLIGNYSGRIISGSDSTLIDFQCQMAAKRLQANENESNKFQRLIWIQHGLKLIDERQRRLVNALRHEDKNQFSEVIQAPVEEVKSFIHQKLNQLSESDIKAADKAIESVYIICEPDKLNEISTITDIVHKNGCSVLSIDFKKVSNHLLATHYEYLNIASAVIICDFNSPKPWLNSKLKDILKAPGNGRTKPFLAKALVSGKPSELNTPIGFGDGFVFDASTLNEKILEPFFNKLNPQ
jgi:hypothetical protein